MITGSHVIIYTRDAEADRVFFRDVLDCPYVEAGDNWLIFKLPPSEVAFHPTSGPETHELYLMCDDIDATVDWLSSKGITCGAVVDQGWGLLTAIKLPGGGELGMYEPKHPLATDLF